MSKNKRGDILPLAEGPIKVWKENPPGPEQKELDRLFSENIIDETYTPNAVRQKYSIFMKFSSRVFGLHFRKTKAKYGNYVKRSAEDKFSDIPELGSEGDTGNVFKNCPTPPLDDFNEKMPNIEFENAPIIAWKYSDHERKCDFAFVAVPIISGSKDINFSLSEDGMKVKIHYTWPTPIIRPQELFYDEIHASLNSNHPKIHALQSHLLSCGITEKSNPRGSIEITLPIEVQREMNTWKKKAVKKQDGTKIVLLEFKGYQPKEILKDADTSICFD